MLIPVQVALTLDDLGRHEVDTTGDNRVMVSFAGPPSCIRELRSQLQRGTILVHSVLAVPEDKQGESSYRETVRIEPSDLAVPAGVSGVLCEGHNTVPVTVHRIIERLVPVRLESVGEARISQIKVEPAMVLVRGPQDVVDQLRAIPTQPFPLPPLRSRRFPMKHSCGVKSPWSRRLAGGPSNAAQQPWLSNPGFILANEHTI